MRFTPRAEYAFRHPLIRAVAYESQLKADRAELHRRVAAIEAREPESAEKNAALIAEHLEAAGELRRRLRLAHARCNLGDHPRHRRGRAAVGSVPDRSPTGYRPMTPTGRRCESRRAPCSASRIGWPAAASTIPVFDGAPRAVRGRR